LKMGTTLLVVCHGRRLAIHGDSGSSLSLSSINRPYPSLTVPCVQSPLHPLSPPSWLRAVPSPSPPMQPLRRLVRPPPDVTYPSTDASIFCSAPDCTGTCEVAETSSCPDDDTHPAPNDMGFQSIYWYDLDGYNIQLYTCLNYCEVINPT